MICLADEIREVICNFGWKLLRTSAQSAILSLLLWGQQCFRKWKVLSEDDNEVTNDPDVCGV
jgi:hypothetical protein